MIRFLVRAAVHNPVAIHLATLAVVAAGVLAYFSMPREVFPEFALGTVTVTTVYPGASPDDVEKLVTLKIEDELEGIDGIEQTDHGDGHRPDQGHDQRCPPLGR